MLQDVRNARVVWRVRLEGDREDVVLVISIDVKVICSCLVMLKLESCQLQLRHVLNTLESKAMELGSRLRQARKHRLLRCSISSSQAAKVAIPLC